MTQPASSKRPRQEAEDSRAECPFSIRLIDPKDKDIKLKGSKGKKRKRRNASQGGVSNVEEEDTGKKILHQCAPFEPRGSFETHDTMDVHYAVEPARQWADMTRYNSFVLNGAKYYCEGFIYVANDSTIERQKAGVTKEQRKRSEDDWVARILEIRASDEHHVYARVFWMYWPDELPAGTHYGKRLVQGRQPYHGSSELIASNHMDIINVVSVTSMASVNHMIEDKDDDVQSALYWRQALDVRNLELSSIEVVCDCNQPANPDRLLVGCGDPACGKWIHEECLKHYTLMRVYEKLGTDRPHITLPTSTATHDTDGNALAKNQGGTTGEVKEPLSPKESGGAVSAQHSIDVKADTVEVGVKDEVDDNADEGGFGMKADGAAESGAVLTESAATMTAAAAPTPAETSVAGSSEDGRKSGSGKSTSLKNFPPYPTIPVPNSGKPKRQPGRPRKRQVATLPSFDGKKKPYEGLFEAKLILAPLDPPMIEITDLRPDVTGGDKVWNEPADCPICGSPIR